MKIFISYRRDDREDTTGRLYDRLEAHFGRDALFIDVHNIPFGVDFREHLSDMVGNCDVLLAVIGDRWLEAVHSRGPKKGQRRLDDPTDFVRIEIESALQRGIPVVPVLVANATMPGEDDLPPGLKQLAYRNAAEVRSGRDFRDHAERLIRGLEWVVTEQSRKSAAAVKDGSATSEQGAESFNDLHVANDADLATAGDWEDEGATEFGEGHQKETGMTARVVHMHETTGTLADLTIPSEVADTTDRLDVSFVVPPAGTVLRRISLDISSARDQPVRYFRLRDLRLGPEWWPDDRPVIVRVYRSAPSMPVERLRSEQGIRVEMTHSGPVSGEDLGVLVKEQFNPIIRRGTPLPCTRKLRVKTIKDNQRLIRIAPAITYAGSLPRVLPNVAARIWALAKAGIAWKEFSFRIDPDGRITIVSRDPISEQVGPEMLVVG
jgi:hypothetical protein